MKPDKKEHNMISIDLIEPQKDIVIGILSPQQLIRMKEMRDRVANANYHLAACLAEQMYEFRNLSREFNVIWEVLRIDYGTGKLFKVWSKDTGLF